MMLAAAAVSDEGRTALLVIGLLVLGCGSAAIAGARNKAERVAWLRLNGISLAARIISGEKTGASINDVPVHRLALEVAGPQGSYTVSIERVVSEHEAASLIGGEMRVRANQSNLQEVMPED